MLLLIKRSMHFILFFWRRSYFFDGDIIFCESFVCFELKELLLWIFRKIELNPSICDNFNNEYRLKFHAYNFGAILIKLLINIMFFPGLFFCSIFSKTWKKKFNFYLFFRSVLNRDNTLPSNVIMWIYRSYLVCFSFYLNY